MQYVLGSVRGHRRHVGALAALALPLLLAACGSSSTPAAAPPLYPPATGTPIDPALVSSLGVVLRPLGTPSWATPPVNAAAARVAVTRAADSAVVVPYRSGRGWCLGYIRGGQPSFGWCTPIAGSQKLVEGGVIFTGMTEVAVLARASRKVERLVVTLADGRRLPVPIRHGVALTSLAGTARPGDRPVTLTAIGPNGTILARRGLGWSAARWKTSTHPLPPPSPARLKQDAKTFVPCVGSGTPKGTANGVIVFTEVSSDHPSALVTDFLPAGFGPFGGRLYVKASQPVKVTLVDGDGARRPIDLGGGRCAYVALSPHDRKAPFRLEARNAAGRVVDVDHPTDWSGFPTDGD
jgi:hypothetical protein